MTVTRPTRLAICALAICLRVLFALRTEAGQVDYTYDDAGRLIRADFGDRGVIEYTYDAAGNLVSRQVLGAPTPGGCAGDCNGNGNVTVDELILCVNIALGNQPVSSCPDCDPGADGAVTVDELVKAVNAALNGCVATAEARRPG